MITQIEFNKMVASVNDFIITDNRRNQLVVKNNRLSDFARKLCDRKFGIGADGLLIIEKSRNADLRMRIFNPDGSEAEMCGNGLRCAALWAKSK
ncbi:MAG: diaminopimelate epimerase, partial [Candidatus Omnitrophica bacterium]|nr:diaminopimelate epimerase [Candidatus Omnitrophota bacterium]